MEHEAQEDGEWPPNQVHQKHLDMAHLLQHDMRNKQAYSSGKSRNSPAITVDISQEELLRVQEIISLMNLGQIQVILRSWGNPTPYDLSMSKN